MPDRPDPSGRSGHSGRSRQSSRSSRSGRTNRNHHRPGGRSRSHHRTWHSPGGQRLSRLRAFARRNKALTVIFAICLALVVVVGGWVIYLNSQLGDVSRFPITAGADEPSRVPGKALNILLIGADDPDDDPGQGPNIRDELAKGTWAPGAFRSDTTMVLHLDPDHKSAQIVSIPRDSWVPIPGHGRSKLNAAFSWGGPSLLRSTVEQVTGLYIDHVVVIDFAGFVKMTQIVGGVDVYVPQTVTDTARDITWRKGTHHLEGENALYYVRQRYGLPNGDFDRIQRQQNFLRALMTRVAHRSTLTNPAELTRLAGHLSDTIAVDSGLTTGRFRSLVLSMVGFRSDSLRFVTAPFRGLGREGSASVVYLDRSLDRSLFDAVGQSNFEGWYAHHQADLLPSLHQVD